MERSRHRDSESGTRGAGGPVLAGSVLAPEVPSPAGATVVRGIPDPRLCELAEGLGADMVALGSHGRGGYERLLLGSVAEEVLRRALLSVLVMPAREGLEPGGVDG